MERKKRRRVNSISFFAQVSKNVQVIISGTVCHHIIKEKIVLTPVNICAQVLHWKEFRANVPPLLLPI